MSNRVSENLQSMFSKMEHFISTKTVVGDALTFGDIIIVPLVEIIFGAGTGIGEGKEEKTDDGKGGGAIGAKISPVAVIVIINGNAQLIDVKNKDGVNKLIDLIPGILSKVPFDSLFKKGKDTQGEQGQEDTQSDKD